MGFPSTYPRNLVINPSGTSPGALETYMRCAAWWILDLPALADMPDLRGGFNDNPIVPQVGGRLATTYLLDQGVYVMEMRVAGDVNASGVDTPASASQLDVLEQNIEFLKTNVGRPPSGGTRTSKFIRPWRTLTDDVQTSLRFGEQKGAMCIATLTVVVPGGVYGD